MRVIITTPIFPPEIGGPASYVPKAASYLVKKYDVVVVCFSQKKITSQHEYTVKKVRVEKSFLSRQFNFFKILVSVTDSKSILYCQGTLTVGLATALACKLKKRRFILKFVGDEVWESFQNSTESKLTLEEYYESKNKTLVEKLKIYLHRWILNQAHTIVTPSQYLKDFLVEYHHASQHHIEVIPNPVEIIPESPKKKDNQLISVGRLVSWKRIDKIIEAVVEARKSGRKWNLVIVGEGPEKSALVDKISDLKAEKYISLLGSLSKEETHKKIAESNALILWSTYEGQSHVLIESMMLGTPVVASDITPNRELIDLHRGVLVENYQDLVESLESAGFEMADAKSVAQYHSWENHIQKLEKIL